MNLNSPLNGVSCSLGVPVDVIEAKPRHAHVREVNTCKGYKNITVKMQMRDDPLPTKVMMTY